MKRNFFKNSLAAFAFTLAIVASFAFSNAEYSSIEYIQKLDSSQVPVSCDPVSVDCSRDGDFTCTYEDVTGTYDVYEDKIGITTTCTLPLLDDRDEDPDNG
jgi:hypothetical protein